MRFIGKFLGPVVLMCIFGVQSQENAIKNISPSLLECYENDLYEKWNLLPQNIETLIAIIRKIEDYPGLNMDLRYLATALLHRFRQDGIVRNPKVRAKDGVTPYAPLGDQFHRHAQTLHVIPGNAFNFPNDSITALERCSLHNMLSSSIDLYYRKDETVTCKGAQYANFPFYSLNGGRYVRSAERKGSKDEVETLTPEQLEMMTKGGEDDPNTAYPALPPNHPSARLINDENIQKSGCPTENGVIKTPWGTVSAGLVLAGIAAGLEPQQIRIGDLIRQQVEERVASYPTDQRLDNKFLGTLAGDLAEVALTQGAQSSDRFSIGVDGNWNSSSQPLYYFLRTNENLEMTAAEIRGGLDGLILAYKVPEYYGRVRDLKLSQVLDMYYSNRGFFDSNFRACNRRKHLLEVAPTETLISQTHSAAIVLSTGLARATFSSQVIEEFATRAVKDFQSFVPTMNNDQSCEFSESQLISEAAVDLTIILDTSWPYEYVWHMLMQLLSGIECSRFNSNFTIMNGHDGSFIINSTYNAIDLANINRTQYERLSRGFDLQRAVEKLRDLQKQKLNNEQRLGRAGGKSDVVLIVPYQTQISQQEKEFVYDAFRNMREEVPDTKILFLSEGMKDRWTDLVVNPEDIVAIRAKDSSDPNPSFDQSIDQIQQRINQVPRRLINSQCGAWYNEAKGSTRPHTEYIGPNGIHFHRIHPNYFNSDSRIKIQGMTSGSGSLKVCHSRELLHVNATGTTNTATCSNVGNNIFTLNLDCDGANYINDCKPYYISIASNAGNSTINYYGCTDSRVCRYPDNLKYTISFENLVCRSGSSAILMTPALLLLVFARFIM